MKDTWVKLSEKMPETEDKVMVYTSNGIKGTGKWRKECKEAPYGEWFELEFLLERPEYDYIIFWCPVVDYSILNPELPEYVRAGQSRVDHIGFMGDLPKKDGFPEFLKSVKIGGSGDGKSIQ